MMKLSEFKAKHFPWSKEYKAREEAEQLAREEEARKYHEMVTKQRYASHGSNYRSTPRAVPAAPAAPAATAAPASSSSGSDFLMGALVGNALSSLMHAGEASSSRRSSSSDDSSSSSVWSRSESSSNYDSSSSSDWGSSSSSDWSSD
jgi:hypothetical protein